MTKHTFNASNWTGETVTIDVNNNRFRLNGYDFTLKYSVNEFEELTLETVKCFGDDWNPEFPLVTATRATWHENPKWDDERYMAHNECADIYREDKEAVVAIAKVLCNTI